MTAQFMRFALVGVTTNLLGYLLYLALTSGGVEPKLTMSILYVVGVLIGYYGHKSLTFKQSGNSKATLVKYFASHVFGYLLNLAILITFVDHMGFAHQLVQAFGIMTVAATQYFMMKFFVFPNKVLDE